MNDKAITKLCGFRSLGENWNGYGCCAWYDGEKSEEYIRQVTTLLRTLPYEMQVFPLQNTRIVQIEYQDDDWYIEFELNEDHTAHVYEETGDFGSVTDENREYACYWWQIAYLLENGGTIGRRNEASEEEA